MAKKKVTLGILNQKLDLLTKAVKRVERKESQLEKEERAELAELKKLEEIEKKIQERVKAHPLRKITYKDIAKGALGAFIGVVAHYTFLYGIHVAAEIDIFRATLLFPIAYLLGGIFLYATGFRKVSGKMLWFLPVRLTVLYIISLVMAIAVLYLFHPEFSYHFWDGYKQVAAVNLTALIGACTADLIGKE
ncbi:TIGR02587 family membrane protein [Candidatus Woesearchaeota archaeon]|nr:TIGR02587 family membrane protein [Candidatus Woesearchaeota archaeon]